MLSHLFSCIVHLLAIGGSYTSKRSQCRIVHSVLFNFSVASAWKMVRSQTTNKERRAHTRTRTQKPLFTIMSRSNAQQYGKKRFFHLGKGVHHHWPCNGILIRSWHTQAARRRQKKPTRHNAYTACQLN